MEKQELIIKVEPRNLGIKETKRLRKQNYVPAVVYGPKQKSLALFLDIRIAEKYATRKFENKIFTFQSEDKNLNGLKVIKKAMSLHLTKRKPLHIDFLSLDMQAELRVNVEIRFEGKAKGVKEEGGVFNILARTIEVECLPKDIPNFISIDISQLSLNQNLHVSDLEIPKELKLITKKTQTLCSVAEIKEEATPSPEETAKAEVKPEATAAAGATKKEAAPQKEKKQD